MAGSQTCASAALIVIAHLDPDAWHAKPPGKGAVQSPEFSRMSITSAANG
jgi:hypothetical protein